MTAIDDLNARLTQVQTTLDQIRKDVAALATPTPTPVPVPPPVPPTTGRIESENFTLTGTWQQATYPGASGGKDEYTAQAGARAHIEFVGSRVELYGTKAAHHGKALALVDGQGVPQTVDFYAPVRQENTRIAVWEMTKGQHFIDVAAVGDGVIALDYVLVDPPVTPTPVPVPTPIPVPTPTPTPSGPLGVLHVAGAKLVDAAGARVVLRGTNQYMDSYNSSGDMTPVSNWAIANRDKLAAEWASYGMNFIRLPTNNDRGAGYIARLKQWTDALAAKGIRSVLCPFGGVAWAPSAANGSLVADQWVALGKPAHVLVETVNEPNPQAYKDDPPSWLAGNQQEIAAIRAKGYPGPILVGCRGWCWTIPVAEAKTLAAADPNLVFMSHRYAYDGNSDRPANDYLAWVSEWKGAAQQGLAVGVGEYGWYNNGGSYNPGWLQGMADAQVQAVKDGWLSISLSWIFLWDAGSQIVGAQTGGDWWPVSQGEAWKLNPWGSIAVGATKAIAAAVG